jgi:hypothetical protein
MDEYKEIVGNEYTLEEEEVKIDNSLKGVFDKPMIALLAMSFVVALIFLFISILVLIFANIRNLVDRDCVDILDGKAPFLKNSTHILDSKKIQHIIINIDGESRKTGRDIEVVYYFINL